MDEPDGTSQAPAAEKSARIHAAFEHAANPRNPQRLAIQLGREAVGALRQAANLDDALQSIALPLLGALVDRHIELLPAGGGPCDRACRVGAWDLLDILRRPSVLTRIERADRDAWAERILTLIDRSDFTVGPMFRQRAEFYGSKTLFVIPRADGTRNLTWRQAASRVDFLARGLLSLDSSDSPRPIAILSENRIEMALVDLACLTTGLVNVMIPANATEADVAFMLRHSGAGTVIVSNARQLEKVLKSRDSLEHLTRVVAIDPAAASTPGVMSLDELAARALHIPESLVIQRSEAVRASDRATVMYTSGTTGQPKGIQFSQRNLVFKRFARALALPEIGEKDRFLCFLPLFHTFGRFLEMLGCVFWGSTYCFVENASLDTLLRGMKRYSPTVFISVPKRWMQLYDAISQLADPLEANDDELARALREITGGQLRWGLSAAGYLPADIFRFFQRHDVELLSGFGMTEATGGITMTPPGEYIEDSLGTALPGIELKLADDRELLVRGSYVMMGYLDPPAGEASMDADGWLATGDLMEVDPSGHLRLIDRKKEIYKNVKGETIAPQRVESMFRDFDSVGRVFLVGDHREYNTLLIYPDPNYNEPDLSALPESEACDHFRSLVVSVNKFLAPYERVVDFALIDRDLDIERDELTEKGTPRRRNVERNFTDVIASLYRRADIHVGDLDVTLPNWLFQVLGLTAQDVRIESDRIVHATTGAELTLRRQDETHAQIGDCIYSIPSGPLNIGILLTSSGLWLGNAQLVDFLPLELKDRQRPGRPFRGISWVSPVRTDQGTAADVDALEAALSRKKHDLLDLHVTARLIVGDDEALAVRAIELVEKVLEQDSTTLLSAARLVLTRAAGWASLAVQRRAFRLLLAAESESRFRRTVELFLASQPELIDESHVPSLAEPTLSAAKVETMISVTQDACAGTGDHASLAIPLVRFLAAYGAVHPISYRRLRACLTRMSLFAAVDGARDEAERATRSMEHGFREWLGPSVRIAVDSETGSEYRWEDVVSFEDGTPEGDRERLLAALRDTPFLREALFLFSSSSLIHLSDIPPGGVWIRLLGSGHGKSVYRITVQTRYRGAYELAANVSQSLSREEIEEEIHWLILSGDPWGREPLVENFGGFWPEPGLWSEEYISGDTLDRAMRRLARRKDDNESLRQVWPFLAWATLSAWVDFWSRSGKRWEIADPSMTNIVVPAEDYQVGARIVSLSARKPHIGLPSMLESFMEGFVRPVEAHYPALAGLVGWNVVLSAVLEIVGEDEGLALFEQAASAQGSLEGMSSALRRYIDQVRTAGFRPMRLYFAIERYLRWEELSENPTRQARARTLQELYDTYSLDKLTQAYPEVRFRLFRDTVLRAAPEALRRGLDELIARIRSGELHEDEFVDAVADLRSRCEPSEDDEYFLTRISFPHLRPEDTAGFVSSYLGGRQQSEIMVALEDADGERYRVRHALNPKEVERLHRLFLAAKLEVRFRTEHQYLVARNDRGQIIAGIYYEVEEDAHSAHLEKIVVADPYRRKGVADGVINEFFNRLRAAGIKTVTTGFFRPEFFYAYGFRIEPRYAGLVKSLEDSKKLRTDS